MRRSRARAAASIARRREREPERQREVDTIFQANADHWSALYEGRDLTALVYQRRRDLALEWVDELRHPSGSRALDVGCGAGLLSAELAKRAYRVEAVDHTDAMLTLARGHAQRAGVSEHLGLAVADAHRMPWPDTTFSVVTALGVLPWLHSPELAVREMARVTQPGGHLVVTADNSVRLGFLLDPFQNPALRPIRRAVSWVLRRRRDHEWWERRHAPWKVNRMLVEADFRVVRAATVGFADFSFWRRRLVPERRARALHFWLQRLADRGMPVLRLLGSHYVVLAAKRRL